jgi:hypothetical protein
MLHISTASKTSHMKHATGPLESARMRTSSAHVPAAHVERHNSGSSRLDVLVSQQPHQRDHGIAALESQRPGLKTCNGNTNSPVFHHSSALFVECKVAQGFGGCKLA